MTSSANLKSTFFFIIKEEKEWEGMTGSERGEKGGEDTEIYSTKQTFPCSSAIQNGSDQIFRQPRDFIRVISRILLQDFFGFLGTCLDQR